MATDTSYFFEHKIKNFTFWDIGGFIPSSCVIDTNTSTFTLCLCDPADSAVNQTLAHPLRGLKAKGPF